MMQKKIVINYEFLEEIIRIKSYDSDGKNKCADRISDELEQIGFDVKIFKGYGAPIIYAEYVVGAEKNILFYSHYDVKPEGNINEWRTNPFEPYFNSEEGRIYARGSGDDKGQIYATIMGIKNAISKKEKIQYNISLLIEGDEESGSNGLCDFSKKELSDKFYDTVIINDSHWLNDNPVIYCGCRGQLDIKLKYTVTHMKENYHAGNYGGLYNGAARDFISILKSILQKIDIIIEQEPTTKEYFGNAASLTYISSGDEKRSLIPKKAIARIDVRYNNRNIVKSIENVLDKIARRYGIEYEFMQNEEGFFNLPDERFISKAKAIIDDVTGLNTKIIDYCGAYLPLNKLKNVCGIKYIIPFAQSDECNHSPNENIAITNLVYGIEIIEKLLIN